MRHRIAYYYDMTWTPTERGKFSEDSESQLVQLCGSCAYAAEINEVAWAGAADEDACCDQCGAWQDQDATVAAESDETVAAAA